MNTSLKKVLGGSIAVLLMGAGCLSGGAGGGSSVVIGVMAPLTGDAAVYGESTQRGVELALADSGLENTVTLAVQDSRCDAKDATNAVNSLINIDGTQAIVGELCSGATLAAAPVAEENEVVLVSPASTAPTVTEAGEYIFRVIPSDALQGAFGAELVAGDGYTRLAVLYVNDDYGTGFQQVLAEQFPSQGGTVVAAESFGAGDTDLRTQLTKIRAANPDALYIISNSPDAAIAGLKQVKELGLSVALYASEGLKSQDVVDGAAGAAEGMVVSSVSPGNEAFATAYTQAYGEAPGPFAAQAYDAMTAILDAVEAGATTGPQIQAFLDGYAFTGVTGELAFDENGDVAGVYEVSVVENGAFVTR